MAPPQQRESPWSTILVLVGVLVVVGALWIALGPRAAEQVDQAAQDSAVAEEDPTSPPENDGTESPAPTGSPEPTEPEPTEPGPAVSADPALITDVGVLNGAGVPGLAGQVQARLIDGGWPVPIIDTSSAPPAVTTAFYPPGLQESAEALAAQFPEIAAVEPSGPGLTGERIVLIVTADYVDALGDGSDGAGTATPGPTETPDGFDD